MIRRNWSEDELILALELYSRTGSSVSKTTPAVIELAREIGRTPSSVVFKIANLASCDPTYRGRGRTGMPNRGKLDQEIWSRFENNWGDLFYEKEQARARLQGRSLEELLDAEGAGRDGVILPNDELPTSQEGLTREAIVRLRVNQYAFRKHILSIYRHSCCMTGISEPGLLTASHIVPWSVDAVNRLNPSNGLCLNALHDRAFDRYYITVSAENYRVWVSKRFKSVDVSESMKENFLVLQGIEITLPERSRPSKELLQHHNDEFMKRERRLASVRR